MYFKSLANIVLLSTTFDLAQKIALTIGLNANLVLARVENLRAC